MSLLLEALKKAELAKQAAKEQPPDAVTPPFTRDRLPDISQPMEIHSEDLTLIETEPAPMRASRPALELALEEAPPAAPAAPPAPPPNAAPVRDEFTQSSESMERKQAQQLFEAKELDVNPRKPFYITVGALGLFALGTVGYFWYELQPKNNYRIPPPLAQPAAPPMATAPAAVPASPAVVTAAAAPATPTVSAPAAPPTAAASAAAAPAAAAAATAAPAAPVAVRSGARSTARTPAAKSQPRAAQRKSNIQITPARVQVNPVLEAAFQAFNAGDLARARDDYRQVLRESPDNRDALLGLAAVQMQAKHFQAAERLYTRLLELDPRDAYAQAGLIGLKGQVDPLATESRLKNMIAAQPEASFLNFTLGNQYAAQGRWAEAQQAYFSAYTGNHEHADFAYNLAVSLDKLHQAKQALEYYRRALTLAEGHPVSFDRAQVSKRVSQLTR